MNVKSPRDDSRNDPRWCGCAVGGGRTGKPRHPRDRLPTLFYVTQPLLLKRFAQDGHTGVTPTSQPSTRRPLRI